jgi:hypothetical protein
MHLMNNSKLRQVSAIHCRQLPVLTKGYAVNDDTGFLSIQVAELEKRFSLSFFRDDSCIEYFLDSRQTSDQVSENLIVSWDTRAKGLYISKFYPRLYLQAASKYLSAACFYLMIFHAVHEFHLKDECIVWLETDTGVFQNFYSKLPEFEFRIARHRVGERVCLKGLFHDLPLKTCPVNRIENLFGRV